jgi:hypothetical protein
MKKLVFIFLIFTIKSMAQFPNKNYNREVPEYNKTRNGLNLGLSYIATTFVNNQFRGNLENEVYKRGVGLNLRASYIYKSLIIDANGFFSQFEHNNYESIINELDSKTGVNKDSLALRHQGYDIFVSYNLMITKNEWLRKRVTPYVGLGYQFSAVALTHKNILINSNTYAATNINSPMWKAGFIINFHRYFNVFAEYKQTLNFNLDDPKKFYQLNFGLTFHYGEIF